MRSSALAACGVLLFAAAAHAQSLSTAPSASRSPIRVGFAGGVVVPRTGASLATLKTGVHGQGFVLLQLPGLPALRFNGDYSHMQFDRSSLTGIPTTSGGATTTPDAARTVLDGVASFQVDLLHGPVRPYVLAGVGAFNVKDVVDAASSASGASSFSATNFGIDGGAGLAIKIGRLDAFLETRLQNVYTKQRGLVDTKSIQSFPVSFGITF
jgi:hypothetical protein